MQATYTDDRQSPICGGKLGQNFHLDVKSNFTTRNVLSQKYPVTEMKRLRLKTLATWKSETFTFTLCQFEMHNNQILK